MFRQVFFILFEKSLRITIIGSIISETQQSIETIFFSFNSFRECWRVGSREKLSKTYLKDYFLIRTLTRQFDTFFSIVHLNLYSMYVYSLDLISTDMKHFARLEVDWLWGVVKNFQISLFSSIQNFFLLSSQLKKSSQNFILDLSVALWAWPSNY